ncbi:MAG: glycosyltransferase, partial [Tepidimonas sp.]|uniref:glycosyltransferase n=1 Tax=Tepidimonas sp. TaxID=2002775 RepID=UPI00259E4C4D
CDLFALPSIEPAEAFGLASAEAMACGKPTVVCRLHNGVDCLNVHGRTSLLVPPRDIDALAAALDQLALDSELRARMGEQAAQWVRSRFTVDHMVQATLDVYREWLD